MKISRFQVFFSEYNYSQYDQSFTNITLLSRFGHFQPRKPQGGENRRLYFTSFPIFMCLEKHFCTEELLL